MSEYEVPELRSMYRSEAAAHVMNFISVLFAFIIAAYLVADKLTRFQTIVTTTSYSLFIPLPITATIEVFVALRDLLSQFGPKLSVSTGIIGIMPVAYIVVPLVMLFGWVISIIFMLQIRTSRHANSN